jgi:hypothetical protein
LHFDKWLFINALIWFDWDRERRCLPSLRDSAGGDLQPWAADGAEIVEGGYREDVWVAVTLVAVLGSVWDSGWSCRLECPAGTVGV